VVDIIDSHDLFKNQWRKRKTFYKKENYKILYTNSINYTSDTNKWLILHKPGSSGTKECKTNNKKNNTVKSNSSSDKSITNDSDEELEEEIEIPKDKFACGVCLLKFKK
jgi:hypothetical protein